MAPHSLRSRPRRSAWVLACLWLLVALMPRRAWAAADMMASPGTAWPAPAVSAGLPPCHGAADEGSASDAQDHGGACGLCLFCAPVFAAPDASPASPAPLGNALHLAARGAAPEGALELLFRPPRG